MNIKGRLVIASYNITYIIYFYGDIHWPWLDRLVYFSNLPGGVAGCRSPYLLLIDIRTHMDVGQTWRTLAFPNMNRFL